MNADVNLPPDASPPPPVDNTARLSQAALPPGIADRDDLLRTLLNTADWIIFSVDTEFRYTSFNALHAQVMKDLYGIDIAVGHFVAEYMPPERATVVKGWLARGMQENYTVTVRNDVNGPRFYDASYYPLRNSAGTTTGVLIVTREVTAREQATAEIRAARDFHLNLMDDFPALVWRSGTDGSCDYVNKTWLRFTGRTFEQELGTGWTESIHPDDAEHVYREFMDCLATQEMVEVEYRLRHHNGEYRWILDTGRPYFDLDGAFAGYIGMCFDVHELKEAITALTQVIDRLDGLRSIDKAILWGQSVEQVAATALHHLRQLVGCERASIMSIDRAAEQAVIRAVDTDRPSLATAGNMYPIECEVITEFAEGKIRIFDDYTSIANASPLLEQLLREGLRSALVVPLLAEGELLGLFNLTSTTPGYFKAEHLEIAREVANQVALALHQASLREKIRLHTEQLETRVAERTAELRGFFDLPQVGMSLTSPDKRWIMINDEFCRMVGYEREELMKLTWPVVTHPDDLAADEGPYARVLAGEIDVYSIDKRFIRKDGSILETAMTVRGIRDDEGKIIRFVALIQDISARKNAERAIQETLQREHELSELKSRFVAMVSHEYRTPLTAIQITLDTLQNYRERLSEAQINISFEKMHEQIRLMTQLVENVLTVGGLEGGRLIFSPERVSLNQFCAEIVGVVATTQRAHERIQYSGPDDSVTVDLDRTLMQLVLTNLLTNALKYSPTQQPVELVVEVQGNWVRLRVTDRGIGIRPEEVAHLFEPFYRAGNVGTVSGTGLGLTIAKYAIDMHGGTISYENLQGQSAFTVTIPTVQQSASG